MKNINLYYFGLFIFFNLSVKSQTNIDSTTIYFNQKRYDKALIFATKYKQDDLLIEKGIVLIENEDFRNAISFFSNAYDLNKNTKDEIEKISILNIIGLCYVQLRDFENAEKYYQKAININTIYSDEYFKPLNALVNLYCQTKDFLTAEKQCKLFLDESKKYKGENSNEYILALRQISLLYLENDKFDIAEKYCIQIINVYKLTLGENSSECLSSKILLGNLYIREGKFELAEKIYKEILSDNIHILAENSNVLAEAYNGLATVFENEFKFDLAEINYINALNIIKEIYNEARLDYAIYTANLGELYLRMEKYKEAEFQLKKSIEVRENLSDPYDYNSVTYYNLGVLYRITKRCKEAEKYYLKSINLVNDQISESYRKKILGLALTYNCLNDTENESKYLLISSDLYKNKINEVTSYFSNNETIQFLETINYQRNFSLSFLFRNPSNINLLFSSCFEEELLVKNLSLRNQERIKKSILNSGNKLMQNKYEQFISNKILLTKLSELPLDKLSYNLTKLKDETEQLEKELTKESVSFSVFKKSISFNQIKDKLSSKEVAIDLVSFNYYKKTSTDSIVYAAFIVKKDSKFPKFITLFEQKQLEFLLGRNITQQDSTRIDKQYKNKAISDLFLKPLEKELQGVTTIYLSPTGLGHQIDFAALPVTGNQTLGEKHNLHILSSLAELLDYNVASLDKKSNIELILYGGIDYNKSNPKAEIDKEIVEHTNDIAELRTRSGISGFDYLKGTNNEVDQIQLKGNLNGFATTIFKEGEATEERIKALDGRTTPYALHLATHGFFFPDPKQELPATIFSEQGKSKIYKASDDPMMRSGLLLAGANNYWGKSAVNTTIEDGILTASEISNLDLSGCQLVVLSACETGLGEINGSEGVFGLQRAFKMAGVKNIIMSLWKVPDAQTAELFDVFYSECFGGKTIHEAFQLAQTKMKAKYSPYYWAGFVLLE